MIRTGWVRENISRSDFCFVIDSFLPYYFTDGTMADHWAFKTDDVPQITFYVLGPWKDRITMLRNILINMLIAMHLIAMLR